MKNIFAITCLLATVLLSCSHAQPIQKPAYRLKGAPCEGCEAVFEFGNKQLRPVDTLVDFSTSGPRLKLTGTVYQPDGKTPAAGVIIYFYHTNQQGLYVHCPGASGWEKRHGSIRGWIRTAKDGSYQLYTLKPGTYPSRSEPAHIHATLLEPNGKYYYLEEWHFRGDPLLYKLSASKRTLHGGDGIVMLSKEKDLLVARRNIILGLNVKDYE